MNKRNSIMKKIIYVAFIALSVFSCSIFVNTTPTNATYAQEITDSENKDELIITLLTPEIVKAIEEYYGHTRGFEIGDSHIRIVKRGDGQNWNVFIVEVKVDTFEGPHNDYFTEYLTFTVKPFSVTLDDYRHSEFVPNKA